MMDGISGWKIFTVRGVPVRLHASLLFLLFYVFMMSMIQLPLIVEQSGIEASAIAGPPWIWAVAFSVSIVISVLLHELGHVFLAQHLGAKVRGITLMMLGGVSQLEEFPEERHAELKVAAIGPAVSLALGFLLYFLHGATTNASIAFFAFWMAQTNFALGIFNLLPAFPTDGGRMLRAAMATRFGKIRGTQIAVKVSNIFVALFAVIGILQFNILLILISFFIFVAGRGELFVSLGEFVLKGTKVIDVGKRLPVINDDASIMEAAQAMLNSRSLILPTTSSEAPFGLITAEAIRALPRAQWMQTMVKELRLELQKGVNAADSLEDVFALLSSSPLGAVPIMEDGRAVGLLKRQDVVNEIEFLALRNLVHPHARISVEDLRPDSRSA